MGATSSAIRARVNCRFRLTAWTWYTSNGTHQWPLQALLSSWCCTAHPEFKRLAGLVPYLLPPHTGQTRWRGNPWLRWEATALADAFAAQNDTATAAKFNASVR